MTILRPDGDILMEPEFSRKLHTRGVAVTKGGCYIGINRGGR